MKKSKRFKDKIVIVTGASRGLGKEIALSFVKEGAIVIGCARTRLKKEDNPFEYYSLNIGSIESMHRFVNKIIKRYKKIDILVNNAAIPGNGGINDLDEAQWNKVLNVNLKGPVFLTKFCIPYMRSGSNVIFISSRLSEKVFSDKLVYSISKAGLTRAAKNLAYELAEAGIRVNIVNPSIMPTRFRNNKKVIEMNYEKIMSETPLKKVCVSEHIVQSIMFLCSGAAEFITGITLPVDGGRSL